MVGNDWDIILGDEYKKDYYLKMIRFLNKEYKEKTIFPVKKNIFRALKLTTYDNIRVVILGQDPYHGINEADGLAFSVGDNPKLPPSLVNIYKELLSDVDVIKRDGDLSCWSKEGVLLLNTVLTVEKDKAASHKNIGWEIFTDEIIKKINEKDSPVVFILWGNFARNKKKLITNKKHFVIEAPHPSPFSAYSGFLGSKPFSRTNAFLKENGLKEINW